MKQWLLRREVQLAALIAILLALVYALQRGIQPERDRVRQQILAHLESPDADATVA